MLWAWSYPGGDFFLFAMASLVLGCFALLWILKLLAAVQRRDRAWIWFAVAPMCGVAVLALLVADVPLQARWALSRGAFEDVAESAIAPAGGSSSWAEVNVPERIGLYDVVSAVRVPQGVIFWEATGNFMDDAGFAYLPDGPAEVEANGSFESPRFHHLDGPWYTWTASW
jgi:hypothetical protein